MSFKLLSLQLGFICSAAADKLRFIRELLHHGRRVGDEEKTEIRVVSG